MSKETIASQLGEAGQVFAEPQRLTGVQLSQELMEWKDWAGPQKAGLQPGWLELPPPLSLSVRESLSIIFCFSVGLPLTDARPIVIYTLV